MNALKHHFLHHYFILFLTFTFTNLNYAALTIHTAHPDEQTIEIMATINLEPNDFLYKDYLNFSVDSPDITLSEWKSSIEPTNQYDIKFKNNKKIFTKEVTFTLTAHSTSKKQPTHAYLLISYSIHSKKRIIEKIIPLTFKTKPPPLQQINSVPSQPFLSPLMTNSNYSAPISPHPAPISPLIKQLNIINQHLIPITNWPHIIKLIYLIIGLIGLFFVAIELNIWFLGRLNHVPLIYELKKLYVLLIIALTLYHSRIIVPIHVLLYTSAWVSALTGIIYIYHSEHKCPPAWRTFKTVIGITLVTTSFILAFYGYKAACL